MIKSLKVAAATLAVVATTLAPVSAFAYSPERATYTCNSAGQCVGADHVQFNSFTNNPQYGDERNFLTVRSADGGSYSDSIAVADGKEYVVRFFLHNNAQQSLSGANNYVATGTSVKVALPSTINGSANIDGSISAANAAPGTVSDNVTLTSDGQYKLQYVAGSATIRTQALSDVAVSDSIVTTGAPVGYDALNGNWPGCFEFSGWVTLKVKATKVTNPTTPKNPSTPVSTVTPSALPATGPEAMLGSLTGVSALGYGVSRFVQSRRER